MKVTINVTQEDIDRGTQQSDRFCPIAHACKKSGIFEVYNNMVAVGSKYISTYNIMGYTNFIFEERAELPPEARNFIKAFDKGYKVEPFSFEIERSW